MKRKQRGVAVVELALLLPFIVMFLIIIADFGRALYQYNRVAKSVRNSVRYLSTQPPDNAVVNARAVNLVVYGSIAPTDDPIDPAVTADMVEIAPSSFHAGTPMIRTVTVTVIGYTFSPFAPNVFGHEFASIEFPAISATMRNPL